MAKKENEAMPRRDLDRDSSLHSLSADWEGNNVAFTCSKHNKVFLVSGHLHEVDGVRSNRCPVDAALP
jgi:hypothetical protein